MDFFVSDFLIGHFRLFILEFCVKLICNYKKLFELLPKFFCSQLYSPGEQLFGCSWFWELMMSRKYMHQIMEAISSHIRCNLQHLNIRFMNPYLKKIEEPHLCRKSR